MCIILYYQMCEQMSMVLNEQLLNVILWSVQAANVYPVEISRLADREDGIAPVLPFFHSLCVTSIPVLPAGNSANI